MFQDIIQKEKCPDRKVPLGHGQTKEEINMATREKNVWILIVFILVVMMLFQVMRTTSNNSKELGSNIEKELTKCSKEKLEYDRCIGTDCNNKLNIYNHCKGK